MPAGSDQGGCGRSPSRTHGTGISATKPALYPQYNPEYYATFFEDPDGIRLEIVGRTRTRQTLADRWHEFTTFLNPWAQ